MPLKNLFLISLALISMLILSCSSETRSQFSSSHYAPGTGPADKLQLPASVCESFRSQHLESNRLACRQNAGCRAWFYCQPFCRGA